jgi:hypothetical protein
MVSRHTFVSSLSKCLKVASNSSNLAGVILVCVAETIYIISITHKEAVINIPGYRQMQSSSECYPLQDLARIPDHRMSRRYNRSPRLLLLDNSDRLPVSCCLDELVAGVALRTEPLVSASDPGGMSSYPKSVMRAYRQSTPQSPNKLLDTL